VTSVRPLVSLIAASAMGLSCRSGLAQPPAPILPTDSSGVAVRLEPHDKQTQFELGDPITLDLVFTARSPGYAIFMDSNRFNAPQDLVNVAPTDGWFRSQGNQYGGSPEDLGHDPVHIPVMLNRSIVFQQPGHYEITISTMRLIPSETGIPPGTQCCGPRWIETTNVVGIDILPRDEHEESALVAQLSSEIEKEKPQSRSSDDFNKQQAPLVHELEGLLKNPPADSQRTMELVSQVRAAVAEEEARIEKQKEARQAAAIRLSYLQGDDALRAKVRWILADKEGGSNDDTGQVMLHGLAHSRNLQLQMELLQAAWDDTQRVPTYVLQSALQQTKAFLQNETFDLYDSHGVPGRMLPHTEVVEEYNRELGEIVATLSQRTGSNREQTAYYLITSGHGLNPADALKVRAVIAEEFSGMSPGLQSTLLGMRWKELCDPALPVAPEPLKSACASSKPPSEAEVPAR
jgi:hypothetical protein